MGGRIIEVLLYILYGYGNLILSDIFYSLKVNISCLIIDFLSLPDAIDTFKNHTIKAI